MTRIFTLMTFTDYCFISVGVLIPFSVWKLLPFISFSECVQGWYDRFVQFVLIAYTHAKPWCCSWVVVPACVRTRVICICYMCILSFAAVLLLLHYTALLLLLLLFLLLPPPIETFSNHEISEYFQLFFCLARWTFIPNGSLHWCPLSISAYNCLCWCDRCGY